MKPLLLTLTILTILSAQFAYAQEARTETKPEVQADGTLAVGKGFVPCSGANCSACDFAVLGNTAIKWLITIAFLFFAVLAVRAGIKLVVSQGNPSALTDAKSSFTNAFVGLVIIFLAFLIVDTIMRQLVKGNGTIEGYGPWSEVQCSDQVKPKEAQVGYYEGDEEFTPPVVAGVATPSGDPSLAGAGLTAAEAKSRLTAAGIGIKPTAILAGVRPHVISEAIRLKNACACNLYVTDATGPGHGTDGAFTHEKGFKLDFRSSDNPALLTYIKQNYKPAGKWKDGTPLYYAASSCATYALESDHVDVVYRTGC